MSQLKHRGAAGSACPRTHADLRFRNADFKLDDLPDSMRLAYEDAVRRGCGCATVPRLARVKANEEGIE